MTQAKDGQAPSGDPAQPCEKHTSAYRASQFYTRVQRLSGLTIRGMIYVSAAAYRERNTSVRHVGHELSDFQKEINPTMRPGRFFLRTTGLR